MERELMIERTMARLQAARERGRVGGRKKALSKSKLEAVKKILDEGAPRKDMTERLNLEGYINRHFSGGGAVKHDKLNFFSECGVFNPNKDDVDFDLTLFVSTLLFGVNPTFVQPGIKVTGELHHRGKDRKRKKSYAKAKTAYIKSVFDVGLHTNMCDIINYHYI